MTKLPPNHRKLVTKSLASKIQAFANRNTPTGLIAYKMGRTENSIKNIASAYHVSLLPINKHPYNRKSKSN